MYNACTVANLRHSRISSGLNETTEQRYRHETETEKFSQDVIGLQNIPFQQILSTLIFLLPWTALLSQPVDRTGLIMLLDLFFCSFFFNF